MLCKTRWAVLLVFLFCAPAIAGTLSDPNLNFSIIIPNGFVADASLESKRTGFVYAFHKPGNYETVVDPRIVIERLHCPLPQAPIRPEDMPKNFNGTITTWRWHGFDINGAEIIENVAGDRIVTYKAQVPLEHEAIQIWATGSLDHGDQTRALMYQLLTTLDGKSNWTDSVSSAAVSDSLFGKFTMLSVGLTGIAIGFVSLLLIRKRTPRGTVLGISAFIYAVSFGIQTNRIAELYMLVGCLRFLGFLGGTLGIVDLVRARRAKPPTLPPFCNQCNAFHRRGAEFCSRCGKPADANSSKSIASPGWNQAVWLTAAVAALMLPVFYVLLSSSGDGDKPAQAATPPPVETWTAPLPPTSQPIPVQQADVPIEAPAAKPPVRVVRQPTAYAVNVPRMVQVKTPMCGGRGGGPYLTVSPSNQPVVGFEYQVDKWMNKSILRTLTPIFPGDDGIAISHSILARPGYAVGAVEVNGDDHVSALQIIFMKYDNGRLNPDDSYSSAWINNPTEGATYRLTGNGAPVVGIFGNRGLNVDGLGLVILVPAVQR